MLETHIILVITKGRFRADDQNGSGCCVRCSVFN